MPNFFFPPFIRWPNQWLVQMSWEPWHHRWLWTTASSLFRDDWLLTQLNQRRWGGLWKQFLLTKELCSFNMGIFFLWPLGCCGFKENLMCSSLFSLFIYKYIYCRWIFIKTLVSGFSKHSVMFFFFSWLCALWTQKLHPPAQFLFTKGSQSDESWLEGQGNGAKKACFKQYMNWGAEPWPV